MHRLSTKDVDFEARLKALLHRDEPFDPAIGERVRGILQDVKQRGDEAVADYTRQFDRLEPKGGTYRITEKQIANAHILSEVEEALYEAAKRIQDYHERMMPHDVFYEDTIGVTLGWRWTALDSVGLYVPGGTASYPSSVLMNAIPAKVAGVKRLVMTVPSPDGKLSDAVLVAARIAGVEEIHTIGGAQACAALAYGTASIRPVDKIVGPGNAYVAEAKRQLFGLVGIDTIAGPSEILVMADNHNDPRWVACDLLSQAEHDPKAAAILITDDAAFANEVRGAIETELNNLPRAAIAKESLQNHGAIILVQNWVEGAHIANLIATEHLELAIENIEEVLPHIRHAGAIFLGRHTPEALGDYIAGPSHVLPTSGAARFSSGLSVFDFLKRSSLIGYSEEALQATGHHAEVLASAETLEAHRRSVAVRRGRMG
jgi:histidinol dehydrogenase